MGDEVSTRSRTCHGGAGRGGGGVPGNTSNIKYNKVVLD